MLQLSNVSYRYKGGDRDVVKDVFAVFERGKFQAIVGPSGSGKSTLLSMMAGLDKPTKGKITIAGNDLSAIDLDWYRRQMISMIFQSFHLFPLLTAHENTWYPMVANGVSRLRAEVRARELLESVGIDKPKHKRYPANLSGGEQQRVAIARSLSTGAKVILADEPTGNLDEVNGNAVVEILRYLASQKYCVIVVTHNLEIAAQADEVYRMSDGVMTKGD